jgi:cell division septum initiation protein DivIVA
MATRESGLTPSATAGSLDWPTFATVRRGYDPAQVLEYVTRLTNRLDALATEVRRLQAELGQREVVPNELAPTDQDQYEAAGARVADLMRTFDQDLERLRQDAEAEAGRIVAEARSEADRIKQEAERLHGEAAAEAERVQGEARTEADRIRLDAQSKAEDVRLQAAETLREAQKESDKVLSSLASRRQALLGELRGIHDHMLGTTKDLEATIEGASAEDQVVVVEDAEARPRT